MHRSFRPVLAASSLSLCILAALTVVPASAQPVQQTRPVYQFDVPAQPLADALRAIARQTGLNVLFESRDLNGRVAPVLKAQVTAHEAVERLLAGTGLSVRQATPTSLVVQRAETGEEARANDGAGGPRPARKAAAEAVTALDSTNEDQGGEETQDMPTVMVHRPFTDANVDIVRTENDVQPYYIFSGEEIANANTVNLEEFLKQRLTMNAVGQTSSQGRVKPTSRVDLRGIGTNQTLVLVNGRRTGGPNDDQFDLNALSPSQIERIEVLPASASAIYGGSAVGGVLNVILKRDFTGGDISLTYDTPMDANASIRSLSAGYGWGLEGGKTNITLRATYSDSRDALRFGERRQLLERGFSRTLLRAPQLIYGPGNPHNFGTTPNIGSVGGEPLVFKEGGPLGGTSLGSALTFISPGTSPDTSLADLQASLLANAGQQNTNLPDIMGGTSWEGLNTGLRTPWGFSSKTYSVMGALRRKMTDRLELIAEAYYNSNEGAIPQAANTYLYVPASSPANPFQQDVYVPAPLASAVGSSLNTTQSFRALVGFVLDLPGDWRAQGDYTLNRQRQRSRESCLDCASGYQNFPGALADGTLNPFVDTLGFPLDISSYMTKANTQFVRNGGDLADIGLRVSGPVGVLPAGRPNLTIGLGHRDEKVSPFVLDRAAYGRFTYFPESQRVSSLYAEGWIPVLRGVPGVRLLEVQLASRLENFSVRSDGDESAISCPTGSEGICTPTPDGFAPEYTKTGYTAITETLGLRYQPVSSVTLRASYATGFLPPALWELHPQPPDPQIYEWGPDPLRGGEQVRARSLQGGNPDLGPMDSESFNFGIVVEPTVWGLEGLRAGIEWFRINRKNLIWYPNSNFLLANQELFAGRIVRTDPEPGDPYGVGPISLLNLTAFNANEVSTDGFDISLGYRRPTESRGVFTLDFLATLVKSYTVALDLDGNIQETVGQANWWGSPLKLRANATLGWVRGPWSLSWTVLYYGQYDQVPLDAGPYIDVQGRTTVPHQIYHSLLASYRFADSEASGMNDLLSDLTVTLGIRNVFDTLPPFDAYRENTGFYSQFGDPRLRSLQLSVRKAFN